ncbi:MAG: PIN domain-containing protein [Desulfobacteraceae bacterium]|nr:PIN domain-containing protein [Desulfobacteraceae bacterium]
MQRVFLDANVLFTAAHNPHGKAALLMQLAAANSLKLFTSAYAREEAERNISAKYPGSLTGFKHLIKSITVVPVTNPPADYPENLPAKDAPIFAAAVYCRATHLLTGDIKHFGPLMNNPNLCGGMIVQTVAEFLMSILACS